MDILISIVTEIGKCLWGPIKRHATYLACYRQNVCILETELTGLEQRRSNVQLDVEAARRQGQELCGEVEEWLTNVASTKSEAERMVARLKSTKCCKGWCWDPIRCYKLGKDAAEISTIAKGQRERNFAAVSHPPPPPRIESILPSRGFQAFMSTMSSMKQVLSALQDDGIHMIGVHGMGGVGKTTLMKEVAKQVEHEKLFGEIVMVTVSQNVIIGNIQKEVGAQLGLKLEGESKEVRAARLSKRLKEVEKASLVILDDLWQKLELSDVGIPYGDEHKGCKVVITTRSLDVCKRMKSQIKIQVTPLIGEEPWNLFQVNAGPVVNSDEVFEVAKNVVKECKGLPLAIVVLGQTLTDERNVSVWNAILERLKQSIPPDIEMQKEVFQSIEFSFDHLRSDEAKLCFLFCSLFPEDYNIDLKDITWYMIGEGQIEISETLEKAKDQVSLLLNKLIASGLLLQDEKQGSVKMHDIVRDVAIWISKKTYGFYSKSGIGLKEWPRDMKTEECQRISLMRNQIDELPEKPECPKLCTLLLSYNFGLERVSDEFFSNMRALEVLDLCRTRISSLPISISCLKNLRVLILSYCRLENLSGIQTLTSLEILDLSWNENMDVLPTELGELTNLRHLNLSRTAFTIPPNVISRLSRLEELYMMYGFRRWQAQGSEDTSRASFAELACLSRLTELQIEVYDRKCFSQDLGYHALQKLARFKIFCEPYFTEYAGNNNLLVLVTSLIPDWAKQIAGRTDKLVLCSCSGMKCLVGMGGGDIPDSTFSNIESLRLYEMEDLWRFCDETPPDGFFSKLGFLDVSFCQKLISIFSSNLMPTAHQLRVLRVYNCSQLLHVFQNGSESGGCDFPMLLPQVETMELQDLPLLTSIWEGDVPPGSLRRLKKLSAQDCDSLENAFSPTLALALEQLEDLTIARCRQLEKIMPNYLSSQSRLFPNLRRLEVGNCGRLVTLFSWRQVRNLRLLEELVVYICDNMVSIIMSEVQNHEDPIEDNTVVLPKLRKLHLQDLQIASFDEDGVSFFDWPSLETLLIQDCPNLKRLPLRQQSIPKLQRLGANKDWFHSLEWEDKDIMSRLETLLCPVNVHYARL